MLSLIFIFAPLVSCCLSPARRPQQCEVALLHTRVRFTWSSLFLELSRALSEVNLTHCARVQLSEPDPFTVLESETVKYHQPQTGVLSTCQPGQALTWYVVMVVTHRADLPLLL